MQKLILLFLFLAVMSVVNAQESGKEYLPMVPKAEIITPVVPGISFKRGIEIIQPDSLYSLNFRFRVQSRAMYASQSESDLSLSEAEARVRRLRLRMEGFMYNPKLSYLIQLSFSRGDMDWDVRHNSAINSSPNVVRDAVVFYRPDTHWTFIFGQTKLPGNRQRVVSSGDLQFIDRSIVNATFNIDRDFGFQAYYQNTFGETFNYILKGALTTGEGRNVQSTDRGLSYTGRVELLPLGEFKNRGDYFEGDLEREESVKISLAGGLNYNEQARRTGGQIGRDLFEQRDITTYIFDGLMKYRGFALYLEYMERLSDNPVTVNQQGQLRHIINGSGLLFQTSYLFQNNFEVAARYAVVTPANNIRNIENQEEVYTAGVTRYLIKHRLKLQGNISYHSSNFMLSGNSAMNWVAGFQIELGI
jgi:phosphate-selective porin OprO and OprP